MALIIKKTTTILVGPAEINVAEGDIIEIKHNGQQMLGGVNGVTIPEGGIITIKLEATLGDL